MSSLHDLPANVVKMIESGVVANFATVTAAGLPIDTPTYYFPSDDLATIDLATGVPNPAKAERARRNPKIGLLIEGRENEPVVVVRAHAAVHDRDIQSNAIRYLSETGWKGISHGITWDKARLAVNYWSRIIIENKPERVYWWDNHAAMDGPPQVWNAAPNTLWPQSDPPPSGTQSPSAWATRPWQEVARDLAKSADRAHLTVLDADGYPVTMRTLSYEQVTEGFKLAMPKGVPWKLEGKASVTFAGFRTFVGEAEPQGSFTLFKAERAMPQHPSLVDTREVLQPSEDTRNKARARLEFELQRRGATLPIIPDEAPALTRLAKIRQARIASDSPITGISEEHGNRST